MEVSEVSTEAHGDGEACMTHLIFPNKLWPEIKNKSKKSSQCMKIYRKPEFSCGQCDYIILLCYILWSHVTNCVATLLRISLKTVHFKPWEESPSSGFSSFVCVVFSQTNICWVGVAAVGRCPNKPMLS